MATDAPKDNMGKGESFSPTDLVATALGTCILTTMGIAAQRMQLDLTGSKAVVTKEMTTEGPRKIARLNVTLNLPAKLTDEQRQKLENAGSNCPVYKTLHPDVQTPLTFHWG